MKFKTVLTILSVFALAGVLSACGNEQEITSPASGESETVATTEETISEETTDTETDTETEAEPTSEEELDTAPEIAPEVETTESTAENKPISTESTVLTTETTVTKASAETDTEISSAETESTASSTLADYAQAYLEICKKYEADDEGVTYALIDVNGDDVPELVADHSGYRVSLYTYGNDQVHTLMDDWGYGAMGNAGYDYAEGKNNMHNHNSDYAGLISYETYMKINADYELETVAVIENWIFEDKNGNGYPDGDEADTYDTAEPKYFLHIDENNKKEITAEEANAYEAENYSGIMGTMTYEELLAELS